MKQFMVFILVIFLLSACKEERNENENNDLAVEFLPITIESGHESHYGMKLSMDQNGKFQNYTTIKITNTSNSFWEEIVFYFIPNMFTLENSPYLENPASVEIEDVKVNGVSALFNIKKDNFTILLENVLPPKNDVTLDIKYSFTMPKSGSRFTEKNNNYYLAQWYPMVATFRNGKWNKEEYFHYGDPYHTSFSDFTIEYEIPNEYTLVTTSSEDILPNKNYGYLKSDNVKEFFIAILKNPSITQVEIDGINIRVFGVGRYEEHNEEILQIARESVQYFQQTIGDYPYKQLDIILDGKGMEYPGVVTAGTTGNDTPGSGKLNLESLKKLVVHEIAHQWFFSVISNDPFNDGWLDESFAELTTALFFLEQYNKEFVPNSTILERFTLPVNLPLNSYTSSDVGTYHYFKPMVNLWNIFEEYGGKEKLKEFLNDYYNIYKYKEIDTKEFIRFLKFKLDMKDNSLLDSWIDIR